MSPLRSTMPSDASWTPPPAECEVAIVGGGPAGLGLATALRGLGVETVVVLERESSPGGAPRHCGHPPFGVVEFKRLLRGPEYARQLAARAQAAGVRICTHTTVTALNPGGQLSLSTPEGAGSISAKRVALCTGAREATRAQRLLGGGRQLGVMSTGALQAMVYLKGLKPFRRPAILGTELVSFSALMTCRHAGIAPAAMIEGGDRITARSFARGLPAAMGVPIHFGASVNRILGAPRVDGVELLDQHGAPWVLEADGLIVSGKFRPEAALLHASRLAIAPETGGPVVDQYGRASDPAYFCAGNLLRPIETSAWSWREGVDAARRIAQDLQEPLAGGPPSIRTAPLPIRLASDALRYVMPQHLAPTWRPEAMRHLQLRLSRPARGNLTLMANGEALWSGWINSRPERRLLIPTAPIAALLARGEAPMITVGLEEG